MENIQDYAIFLMDKDGYIQTWNKGAQINKGYKADEIIGKHFSNFYLQRDKDAKKPERELELAKKLGRVEDEDWRVRKDGTHFWANVVITALYGNDGDVIGYAKVTRDLTERKHQEDTLRQANVLLQQQQKEMQRLSITKDEFISLASHQLRTPATAIKQLLGILLEGFKGDLTDEQLTVIQKAYDSNERQIAIVNRLLSVAQLDGGKVKLQKLPTDIAVLIKDIVEEYADTIARREQAVHIAIPTSLPEINIDAEHLRMALENLIDNASKYTLAGGKITITAKTAKNMLRIEVKDSGVGIAADDISKLFIKFTRIPNELSQKVGGSGLGLYWAYKVIELHGGTMQVASDIHKGTTFAVLIPMDTEHA
ncbi:MAG: sensory box histidine kinase [Candidatus Saccharibacteria bacterium]|nr:sensory box histidine kinase [Candidatus Saccharibacteria bacterium]